MDNKEIAYSFDAVQSRVSPLLEDLSTPHGFDALKQLFWSELNYERSNQTLSLRDQTITQADIIGSPLLLATAAHGSFHIIYVHLASDQLSLSKERRIVTKLLQNHLYALFIFSNRAQNTWHFVNVKYEREQSKRRLFRRITIGPHERLRTAIERVSLLDVAANNPKLFFSDLNTTVFENDALAIQAQHDKAFDVEAVTKQFFEGYKTLFDMVRKDMEKQTGDGIWSHDYALQLLNRCMFLYFIQRKHWLGDRSDFLRRFWESYLYSQHEKDTFFAQWLNVLFFKAFNNGFHGGYSYFPPDILAILALAPFLNGGLFTENDLDRKGGFKVTDLSMAHIITFLERYNFTIAEDSPLDQEVSVDPEMIGKVYESLVNVSDSADERSDAGIFYTPRVEIDLMCRLTLVDYLSNALGQKHKSLLYKVVFAMEPEDKQAADSALQAAHLWQPVYDQLHDVTIVDPACGSGSFLVGMLYVLDDLQQRASIVLETQDDANEDPAYERKKRIIGRNLYGVDVKEWAIHVAELRLWLALIVDTNLSREELHARREPLLPYFTFKIRRGDSLVQEIAGINFGYNHRVEGLSVALKRRINGLKEQKNQFYNNVPSRELRTKDQVEHEERRLFIDILEERKISIEKKLLAKKQELALLTSEDLYGAVAKPTPETGRLQREIQDLEQQLAYPVAALGVLSSTRSLPFVWDISFVEIFAEGQRFDIVIGNPPYVRQEQIADPLLPGTQTIEQKQAYKSKLVRSVYEAFPNFFDYNAAKGSAKHSLNRQSDLYIYFYFHGLSLLNDGGSFCFITSNSWLDVGYGADLQEFLLRQCHVKLILDNEATRSFESASVNTIIALFSSPHEQKNWGLQHTTRFVMARASFEQLLSATVFEEIEAATERTTSGDYRIFPIQQAALLADGSTPIENAAAEASTVQRVSTDSPEKAAQYSGNKWGGKYLRAPDIYWTILEKGKDKLVRLGDVAEVRFGIKTGANEFFYLDKENIQRWGIEKEFLQPAIKSPKECRSITITTENLNFELLMCHKDRQDLKGSAVVEYIKWGEAKGFHRRPSCAGRANWWDLGIRRSPYLGFNYLIDSTAKTLYALNGCFFSDNFHEIHVASQMALPLCLSLNSTVFQLMVNVSGRANFGDGLLKVQAYEVSELLCVHPHAINFADPSIFTATAWNVLTPSPERQRLDAIVFDALNLTQGERDGVYEAVINLVQKRLNKAKSLDAPRERIDAQERKKRLEAVESLRGIWQDMPDEELEGFYA